MGRDSPWIYSRTHRISACFIIRSPIAVGKIGSGKGELVFQRLPALWHFGTLLSVIIVTKKSWVELVKNPKNKTTLYLVLSCLPTVAIALLLKAFAPTLIEGDYLPLGFMITAMLLMGCEKLNIAQNKTLSFKSSILSGVFQGIAVLPGISRSGATITALRLLGVDKEQSADFSFLMSIPIILGSLILEGFDLFKGGYTIQPEEILPLILGTITAFASGSFAIKFFLKMVKNYSLTPFAVYTLLMSVASFLSMTIK